MQKSEILHTHIVDSLAFHRHPSLVDTEHRNYGNKQVNKAPNSSHHTGNTAEDFVAERRSPPVLPQPQGPLRGGMHPLTSSRNLHAVTKGHFNRLSPAEIILP